MKKSSIPETACYNDRLLTFYDFSPTVVQKRPIIYLLIVLLLTAVSACQQPSDPTPISQLPTATAATATAATATAAPTQPPATATTQPSPSPTTQAAYPSLPTATVPATSYPSLPVATATQPPTTAATTATSGDTYLPVIGVAPEPTATAVPPTPTPVPTVDFTAVRASLNAQNQELAFVKLGFHVTLMDDEAPLDRWMEQLDAAGVPIFLKSVDNAEPLFKAQQLRAASGVNHTLVYRSTGDVPLYHLPPADAARVHWQIHRDKFPPELDPSVVWLETINEVDKNQAEWLGQFALETAVLALNDGFKWAAFGWAAGEPEPEQWQTPAMLDFLRLAGENPDRLAIALHEYSYDKSEIGDLYPYKIGRFQELFRIADQHAIPRPTVLITEWGWEYKAIPEPSDALRDIRWAAELYAAYPEVKGAAIWHFGVGCCYSDISAQTEQIIAPLTNYSLQTYFGLPNGKTAVQPDRYQP